MSEDPIKAEPTRLIDEDGEAGRLLRAAEGSFAEGLDEAEGFRRLQLRKRQRTALYGRLAVAAAIVVVAGASSLALHGRTERGPAPVAVVDLEPEPAASHRLPEDPAPAAPEAASVPLPVAPPARLVLPTRPVETEPPSEASCKGWVVGGNLERAVECFRGLSRGAGLGAEVALYRAAQLTAERLHAPARALPLLDEHRSRFPDGAMRGEVEWLRVQSLKNAGRFDEALVASEALLATPAGRTLSDELHMLRGRIYHEQKGDCSLATSEFVALVGNPSPLGDEAELRRAECLEKLGRQRDAHAAYTQYLRRQPVDNEARARDRLRALELGGFGPEGRTQ